MKRPLPPPLPGSRMGPTAKVSEAKRSLQVPSGPTSPWDECCPMALVKPSYIAEARALLPTA